MQLKKPSHPSRSIPASVNCLSTLLKEPIVRSSFVQADGVKLLVPLIVPASTQQSIQVILHLWMPASSCMTAIIFVFQALHFCFLVCRLVYQSVLWSCDIFHIMKIFCSYCCFFFLILTLVGIKQLLYETCLCVWLLSYYEPAIEYLATSRALPRLLEVVKASTKEKVLLVYWKTVYPNWAILVFTFSLFSLILYHSHTFFGL